MSFKSLIENIKARGVRDIANPRMWLTYAEWAIIQEKGITLAPEDIEAFAEQIVYRTGRCSDCLKGGKCWHCKCPMPEKMLTPHANCSQGKWEKVKSVKGWTQYKQAYDIQFICSSKMLPDNLKLSLSSDYSWKTITDEGIHLEAGEILAFCEQIVWNIHSGEEKELVLMDPDVWASAKLMEGLNIIILRI